MKHEGFATSFERLDREILALRRMVLLSSLFSWNYEARLSAARDWEPEKPERWTLFRPLELLAAGLAICVALCSCGEPERDRDIPDIAGPCPGPGQVVHVLGAHRLRDGSVAIIVTK